MLDRTAGDIYRSFICRHVSYSFPAWSLMLCTLSPDRLTSNTQTEEKLASLMTCCLLKSWLIRLGFHNLTTDCVSYPRKNKKQQLMIWRRPITWFQLWKLFWRHDSPPFPKLTGTLKEISSSTTKARLLPSSCQSSSFCKTALISLWRNALERQKAASRAFLLPRGRGSRHHQGVLSERMMLEQIPQFLWGVLFSAGRWRGYELIKLRPPLRWHWHTFVCWNQSGWSRGMTQWFCSNNRALRWQTQAAHQFAKAKEFRAEKYREICGCTRW